MWGKAREWHILYRALLTGAVLLYLLWARGETPRIAPMAVLLILIIAAGLTLTDRLSLFVLPFLLLTLSLIFCYDSYNDFIIYAPLAPAVLACIAVHLIRFPLKWKGRGISLYPMLAVAAATMLGGIGCIGAAEYFSPIAFFYVLALGPGMVLLYLLLKCRIRDEADEQLFLLDLCFFAVAATFVVLGYHWRNYLELGMLPSLRVFSHQWSNNIATMLMLSFPALFWAGEKHPPCYLLGLAAYGAVILSGSRGGLLMASVEVVLCILYAAFGDVLKKPRRARVLQLSLSVFAVLVLGVLAFVRLVPADFISKYEVRRYLLERSIVDFLENPVTGVGLGSTRNLDLYPGKKGTLVWYHMFLPQIVGSMGLLGVLAWGWQLVTRARIALAVRCTPAFFIMLCYAGLLLMSQVNPGEFCPFPYAVSAVYMVALGERRMGADAAVDA